MKILFRFDAGSWLQPRLAAFCCADRSITLCGERDEEPYRTLMRECDVLWHVLRPVTAEAIEDAANLKLIQKIGVGVNTIDVDAAKRRGVAVCKPPGTNSRAVAEMTLLLMLSCLRRLSALDPMVRRGDLNPIEMAFSKLKTVRRENDPPDRFLTLRAPKSGHQILRSPMEKGRCRLRPVPPPKMPKLLRGSRVWFKLNETCSSW